MNTSSIFFVIVLFPLIVDFRDVHGFLASSTNISFPRTRFRVTSPLMEQKNDNKDFKKREKGRDIFYIQEPQLLVCDLCAILIACEILGLLDDLAVDGLQSFTEPITFHSFSTLPLLIKRDSLLSICWILSNMKNDGFSALVAVNEMSVIKSVFASFVDFCSLVIIYTLCSSYLSHQAADGNDVLRQVSTSLIALLSFRFMLIKKY
jgi:hypothetical protein